MQTESCHASAELWLWDMQSWALLEKHSSGEIMLAGDANWIDEDMGPCKLPPSW